MKIYPIFLPHLGCPHRCAYCSLIATIGDDLTAPTPAEVSELVVAELKRSDIPFQIAFYGGSFTALPTDTQHDYLEAVNEHKNNPLLHSIRISTRPDCITENILEMLKTRNVSTLEIGVETLDDDILRRIKRGHTTQDTVRAFEMINRFSFSSVAQLMFGLPGEDLKSFSDTVRGTVELKPDYVRLHPTLIFRGTGLDEMYRRGEYEPLSLETAIEWGIKAYRILEETDVEIIRFGLHEVWTLKGEVVTGPYHPSFGEVVLSRIKRDEVYDALRGFDSLPDELTVEVNETELSQFVGNRRCNKKFLENELEVRVIFKGSSEIPRGKFIIRD
jgi:histone acetyltransferase (RNA polymerase elongator complex component)